MVMVWMLEAVALCNRPVPYPGWMANEVPESGFSFVIVLILCVCVNPFIADPVKALNSVILA